MSGRQPSAWDASIRSPSQRYLSVDGCRVKYIGPGSEDRDAAAVRANHPVPADCPLYYFEVEVVSRGRDGFIGLFCPQAAAGPLVLAGKGAPASCSRPAVAGCCRGAGRCRARQLLSLLLLNPHTLTAIRPHTNHRRDRLFHGGGQAGPAAGLGATQLRVGPARPSAGLVHAESLWHQAVPSLPVCRTECWPHVAHSLDIRATASSALRCTHTKSVTAYCVSLPAGTTGMTATHSAVAAPAVRMGRSTAQV
jgi:hypothetical protein